MTSYEDRKAEAAQETLNRFRDALINLGDARSKDQAGFLFQLLEALPREIVISALGYCHIPHEATSYYVTRGGSVTKVPDMELPAAKPEMSQEEAASWFIEMCNRLAKLLTRKRLAYGDNLVDTQQHLRILYPDGIPPAAYGEVLVMVRIFDKFKRRANYHRHPEVWTDEENPWVDVAGYAGATLYDQARGVIK